MYDIELRIKPRDWAYILLIGVLFGSVLGVMGYWLFGKAPLHGALFGMLNGFAITLLSLMFITFMNKRVLPNIRKRYWLLLAIFFSFMSGFFGALISIETALLFGIDMIGLFREKALEIATGIGILTYIVGALLYRFVRMRNEKEAVDRHYTDSRLRSLETQLNPHFLFNALNSLAELVHRDSDKAEEAILKLSAFLRNTMNERTLLPLSQELQNVQAYIELENIRFDNAIRLNLPPEVPEWHIPKFSIQLLAENAVKHGMDAKKSHLEITIGYDADGRYVTVSNSGAAMHSGTKGIGLANLDERLRLLCGGRLETVRTDPPTFYLHLGACHENTDRR